MFADGKVGLIRRAKVFYLKASRALKFDVPAWVRAKGLRELSNELEEHLPEKPSAAEIVRGKGRSVEARFR